MYLSCKKYDDIDIDNNFYSCKNIHFRDLVSCKINVNFAFDIFCCTKWTLIDFDKQLSLMQNAMIILGISKTL